MYGSEIDYMVRGWRRGEWNGGEDRGRDGSEVKWSRWGGCGGDESGVEGRQRPGSRLQGTGAERCRWEGSGVEAMAGKRLEGRDFVHIVLAETQLQGSHWWKKISGHKFFQISGQFQDIFCFKNIGKRR